MHQFSEDEIALLADCGLSDADIERVADDEGGELFGDF
jgi:hypothetical protein